MKLRNLLGLAELFQPELNIFECDYTLQGETELYFRQSGTEFWEGNSCFFMNKQIFHSPSLG